MPKKSADFRIGSSISYALFHGLSSQGYKCLLQDEPFHWRRIRQIIEEGSERDLQLYITQAKHPPLEIYDFVIQKHQAKWLYDERCREAIGSLNWIKEHKNIILVRDAKEMVVSHHTQLQRMTDIPVALTFEQVGIKQLYDVFRLLKGNSPLIVDTNELMGSPREGMTALAGELGISFSPSMVSWEKVDIDIPSCGDHWYADLMQSKGLIPYRKKDIEVPQQLIGLVLKSEGYIRKLRKERVLFPIKRLKKQENAPSL